MTFALVFFITAGCSKKEQNKQAATSKPAPMKVEFVTVEEKNIPIWAKYTGRTVASSTQEVRARVPGVLVKRYFKDGQYVHKGDKLFMIEQDQYKSALQLAQAKKAQHEAQLKLAKANVARYEPLVKEGLAPRATLEQYQAQVASLKATIMADEAQIKKAKLDLSYTIVRAPISGKISKRFVDVGNLVGQGESTLLTTIVNDDPLYAYFSPPQDDLRTFYTLKDTQKPYAFIKIDSTLGKIRLDGYIDFNDNTVDPQTSTVTMRATLKNPNHSVLPGTFVYVYIFITDKKKFKMIPPDVVYDDQEGRFVYTITKENKLKKTHIELGFGNKFYVNVTKGLKAGDKVAVSALAKLQEGIAVKPIDVTDKKGVDAILKQNDLIPSKKVR